MEGITFSSRVNRARSLVILYSIRGKDMSYLDAYLGKRGNFGSLVMPVIRNFFLFLALLLPSIGVAQSTICGDVFLDQNKSKFKDSDELARANHVVSLMNFTLMNLGQGGFDTTVTDNNGHYCFVLGNTGSYSIFTDIPENMTLISPIEAVGAMPPYSVQVANMNQKIVVNFGLMGTVAEPIWGKCQDGTEDKSVCVHNSEYLMQVTPNNDATTVKPMEVKQESGVYRGNNEAADVVVGELGTRAARNTRDGAVLDELFFTVGKELSNTGKAIKLNAQINRDGSHSFIDPENPTVKATSNANGSYTVVDSASPSVSATLDASGNMTVLDSEDSTKSLSVDGATGKVKVVDSDYPSSVAEINPDGSYTVTDAEFPTLIATVYANNEYVVQDIVNNVVIHIDTSGDYTIVDNNTKTCIILPSDRFSLGKLFKGVFNVFKSVVNTVARFVNKIAGFVSGVARFIAKVAPIISMAFRVVAMVATVASIVFPAACPLFCAVAAFAQQAALISDQVGMFANTVANIADGIRNGGILGGFWSGNGNIQQCQIRTSKNVRDGKTGYRGDGVYSCSRKAKFPPLAYHNYVAVVEAGSTIRTLGMSQKSGNGGANEGDCKDIGPEEEGSCCQLIVQQDEPKRQDFIDNLSQCANTGVWVPWVNDCYNAVKDAADRVGLNIDTAPPCGRIGPCQCN